MVERRLLALEPVAVHVRQEVMLLRDVSKSELADRQKRSWDNPDRRPSHADRRRWISRKMLQKQFLAALPNTPDRRKFRNLIASLLSLCV